MIPGVQRERRTFSLVRGGPFYRLMIRLRLWTPTSMMRCWWVAFIAWIPLALGAVARQLAGMPTDPIWLDLSAHIRLLFTLPMILFADRLLDETAASAMNSMYNGRLCDLAVLDRITAQAERLRDSPVVEAVLLGIALLGGQLVLWEVTGATGVFSGRERVDMWSFPRVWYATLALPLVQFVMFRWLWRWLLWSHLLAKLSRQRLSPLATHADNAGGLAALARPVTGFSGFVLAISAILSAAWGTQVIHHRAVVQDFIPGLVAFLLLALAVALGPYVLFTGHLFRARRRGMAQYGDFMRAYTLGFHAKWIEPRTAREDPLGTPDIQSLADLGQSFQVASTARIFVFGARTIFTVWFAGILPMVPLFASMLTVEQVLRRIVSTVLGGIPL